MKSKTHKKNNNKSNLPLSMKAYMLPVFLVLIVMPLVVRLYIYELDESFVDISVMQSKMAADVFLHYKAVVIYVAASLSLFFLLCNKLLERKIIIRDKITLPALGFLFLGFLSLFRAKSIKVALWGGEELFQGMITYVAYFIIFYYVYYLVTQSDDNGEKFFRYLINTMLVITNIFFIFAVFQTINMDPFSWGWVQTICDLKNATIVQESKIYLTMYHSNYVGVFCMLVAPFVFFAGGGSDSKPKKIICYISTLELFFMTVSSGSKTAIFVTILLVCIYGIYNAYNKKSAKAILPIVLILLAGMIFVAVFSSFTKLNLVSKMTHVFRPVEDGDFALTALSTDEDNIRMKMGDKNIYFSWDEDMHITDESGKLILISAADKKLTKKLKKKVSQSKYEYKIEGDVNRVSLDAGEYAYARSHIGEGDKKTSGYIFLINGNLWFFSRGQDGYRYLSPLGRFEKCIDSKDAFPKAFYGFATYRGYIWSKTIPHLTENIFIGCGPSHYVLSFPNNDYAAKALIKTRNVIYNKPHSWYLQMAMETGVLSLIVMMVFVIWILVKGLKTRLSKEDDLRLACIFSIIGYLLMSIFNDGMVMTAPIFWTVLGILAGMGYTEKVQKQ